MGVQTILRRIRAVIQDKERWRPLDMFERLNANSQCTRKWTGNDRVNKNHYGRVRLNESPLCLKLYWKIGDKSASRLIGAYRFDLRRLLTAGYIRNAPGYPGEVILRFQNNQGIIQIAVNRKSSALNIG